MATPFLTSRCASHAHTLTVSVRRNDYGVWRDWLWQDFKSNGMVKHCTN